MSQHELSEEQARGIAVNELRRECPEFGGDVPRGWTVKAVQAGYRAGYAAATGSVWQADTSFEYDRAIHHNPDAKAWADLFVATYPALADKHDVMLGWFANAMMAMHDHLASKQRAAANLAEAERKGAREVAEWVLEYWTLNLTIHGSGYGADRNADGGQVGVFTRKLRSYLAAPAPEGVTLSDASTVRLDDSRRYFIVYTHSEPPRTWRVDQWRHIAITGSDFDALKAFAAKVGAA